MTLNKPEIRLKVRASWSLLKNQDVIPNGATKNKPNAKKIENTVIRISKILLGSLWFFSSEVVISADHCRVE